MAAAKDTKTYTVAPRRSVVHDGKPYEAGAELVLAVDEGERLRGLGFFVDEDGGVTVNTSGPATVAGASITEL